MGPAYDAVYAIAFGLAAARDAGDPTRFVAHPTGDDIARGIESLSDPTATNVAVADTAGIVAAFRELSANRKIFAMGTFGPLRWETNGAKSGGQVNIWCVAAPSTATVSSFKDSNVVFDIGSRTYMPPNVTGQYFTTIPPSDRGPPTACSPINALPK
jgi:hypothetical protein